MSNADSSPTAETPKPSTPGKAQSITGKWGARCKSYAWRLTAIYVWLKILFIFLGFYPDVTQLESKIGGGLISSLSSVGFAPVNTILLSTILKTGWILTITGFKLFEAAGLLIYIITFPLWVPIVLLFKLLTKNDDSNDSKPKAVERGLIPSKRSRGKLFAIVGSLLLAWFLLYGSANASKPLIPGVILSAIFLALLTYRMFLRVKPEKEVNVDLPPFGWLAKLAQAAVSMQQGRQKKEYKTKGDVEADRKIVDFTRRVFVRITFLLRGQIAQKRISLYVLGEYLFSFIMVAASAILFWALLLKAAYATSLSLLTCLHVSVSHFLPGLQAPQTAISLPVWTSIAPAATAWILFVLCIGPASSMIPERQRATVRGLSKIHDLYRKSVGTLAKERLFLRKIERELKS